MKSERRKAVFLDCVKRFRLPAGLFLLFFALTLAVFFLYRLDLEPFFYAFAISCFLLTAFFVIRLFREWRDAEKRQTALRGVLTEWNALPEARTLAEADWAAMVSRLGAETERLLSAVEAERKETQDFYTAWVHQIKTPIAVMKLALGGSEETDKAALRGELFRIEQYTDMVLAYQRLGSPSNDLVIEEYALDGLIREVIRKYAPQFIYKKLRLEYEGTELKIVTDKKWFQCILEQLISNAVKYTPSGTVAVSVRDNTLTVSDTGVGIAPEDLPRIFEKGYTGLNGRLNDRSSGLGLYLCGKASALLNLPIRAESTVGQGSRFILSLNEKVSPDRSA